MYRKAVAEHSIVGRRTFYFAAYIDVLISLARITEKLKV